MRRIIALLSSVLVVAGCMAPANAVPTTVTATATATATAVATPTTTTVTAPPVTVTAPPVTVTVTVTATGTTTTTTTPTTTTTTTPPPSGTIPAGSEYVAMGDSYSSGEGANQLPGGAQDPSLITGNCRRSSKAAQILLTAQFSWNLINPACGGSTTANVINTAGWEQPQVNLATANTKLVTMTIGGNDVQLLQLLINCVVSNFYGDCISTNTTGYAPTPSTQIATVDTAINGLEPKIENTIRAVIAKSPQAVIRMAGYPWIIAPPGQPIGTCTWLSSGEQSMFDQRLSGVNFAIRQGTLAVAAANPTLNIAYVDPQAAGSPFAVTDNGCSSSPTRYMNAVTGDATNWHPNILGQQDYKALYQASLG